MNARRKKARSPKRPSVATHEAGESRASQSLTLAWTVSVTCVFMANLVVLGANAYIRYHPDAQPARALEAVMLLSAAAMGAASLALLVVVWRMRRLKPPLGYVVFATLVAAALIVTLVVRLLK